MMGKGLGQNSVLFWGERLRKCKEMILVNAKVALAERPNVKPGLLEEVSLVGVVFLFQMSIGLCLQKIE